MMQKAVRILLPALLVSFMSFTITALSAQTGGKGGSVPGLPLLLWSSPSPWIPFRAGSKLSDTAPLEKIEIRMCRGEYDSKAFFLRNRGDVPLRFSISFHEASAGGTGGCRDDAISCGEVVPVNTRKGRKIYDPILYRQAFSIDARETKMFWLTINSDTCSPGVSRLLMRIRGEQGFQIEVPVELEVMDVRLPADMPIAVFDWSMLSPSVNTVKKLIWDKGLEDEYVEGLVDHKTNVFLLGPHDLPWPRENEVGDVSWDLDFTSFDRLARLVRSHGFILLYFGFQNEDRERLFTKIPFASQKWDEMFRTWLHLILDHLELSLGLSPPHYAVYPYDERIDDHFLHVSKILKREYPAVSIFANRTKRLSDMEKADPYIDIWCPYLKDYEQNADIREFLLHTGKPLWTYEYANWWEEEGYPRLKEEHYFSWYRLKPWKVMKYGFEGACYWTALHWFGDPWDPVDSQRDEVSVIYSGEDGPVTSRRWEAWREGLEDYALLSMLKSEIERVSRLPNGASLLSQLDSSLDSIIERGLDTSDRPQDIEKIGLSVAGDLLLLRELRSD